ncbi:hypothetical protein KAI87_09225 [Myxococcota bacterium]|nr:hypothetical protein [Myxococcota bacterium]
MSKTKNSETHQDDYLYDDLAGVDLSRLDLDHIELDEDRPISPWVRRFIGLFLFVSGGLIIWLPSSRFYQIYGSESWIFLVTSIFSILIGVFGGRWLWASIEAATARARKKPRRKKESPKPATALQRWITLILGLGGAAALVFALPQAGQPGSNYSGIITTVGAIVVGGLLGRWLMMQANAPRKPRDPQKPIQFPPWLKWLNLIGLTGLGLFAAFGSRLWSSGSANDRDFSFGGVGVFVGLLGALWITRRFDEWEKKYRQAALDRRAAKLPQRRSSTPARRRY